MAGNRLEKIGTIFSRITGLIRAGAMKLDDKPVWYDVYRAFPPKLEPYYGRPATTKPIIPILYPEDTIRAKFHKAVKSLLPAIDFSKEYAQDVTNRAIEMIKTAMKERPSFTEDEAVAFVVRTLKAENAFIRQSSASRILSVEKKHKLSLAEVFNAEFTEHVTPVAAVKNISDKNVDVKDINIEFKENVTPVEASEKISDNFVEVKDVSAEFKEKVEPEEPVQLTSDKNIEDKDATKE